MPIPRAASIASGSTPSTPTYAFVSMRGNARMTRAKATFVVPIPKTPRPIAITARLGNARPMFARLIARNDPRCRCPSQMPSGIAIRSAIPIASPLITRCSTVLFHIRPWLSYMNRNASTNVLGRKES